MASYIPPACRAFQHRSLSSNVALNTVKCVCNVRVERATARVRERGGDQIAGRPVSLIALLADSGCGEGFEFAERNARCFLVCRHQPVIIQCHRQHGNRFWCRAGEIIKTRAACLLFVAVASVVRWFRDFGFHTAPEIVRG